MSFERQYPADAGIIGRLHGYMTILIFGHSSEHRKGVIAMKNPTKTIVSLALVSTAYFALPARADPSEGWSYSPAPEGVPTDFEDALLNIINYILGFVSILAVLVIIYGGILYLTSAGNEDQAARARSTVASGIVGLIIVGLAFAIVSAVTDVLVVP